MATASENIKQGKPPQGSYAVQNPKYISPDNPTGTIYRTDTKSGFFDTNASGNVVGSAIRGSSGKPGGSSNTINLSGTQSPTYASEQKLNTALESGTAGQVLQAAREYTKVGGTAELQVKTQPYQDMSINPELIKQQEYLSQFQGTTFQNAQGQGFSQNPATVPLKVTNAYGYDKVTFASGRTEIVPTGMDNVYGQNVQHRNETISPFTLFVPLGDASTKLDFGLIGKGQQVVSEYGGIAYAEYGQKVFPQLNLLRTTYGLPSEQFHYETAKSIGSGAVDVGLTYVESAYAGRILGELATGLPTSTLKFVGSKPVQYSLLGIYGIQASAAIATSDNKVLTASKEAAGFLGFTQGLRYGIEKGNPLRIAEIKSNNKNINVMDIEAFRSKDTNINLQQNVLLNERIVSMKGGSQGGGIYRISNEFFKVTFKDTNVGYNIDENAQAFRGLSDLKIQKYVYGYEGGRISFNTRLTPKVYQEGLSASDYLDFLKSTKPRFTYSEKGMIDLGTGNTQGFFAPRSERLVILKNPEVSSGYISEAQVKFYSRFQGQDISPIKGMPIEYNKQSILQHELIHAYDYYNARPLSEINAFSNMNVKNYKFNVDYANVNIKYTPQIKADFFKANIGRPSQAFMNTRGIIVSSGDTSNINFVSQVRVGRGQFERLTALESARNDLTTKYRGESIDIFQGKTSAASKRIISGQSDVTLQYGDTAVSGEPFTYTESISRSYGVSKTPYRNIILKDITSLKTSSSRASFVESSNELLGIKTKTITQPPQIQNTVIKDIVRQAYINSQVRAFTANIRPLRTASAGIPVLMNIERPQPITTTQRQGIETFTRTETMPRILTQSRTSISLDALQGNSLKNLDMTRSDLRQSSLLNTRQSSQQESRQAQTQMQQQELRQLTTTRQVFATDITSKTTTIFPPFPKTLFSKGLGGRGHKQKKGKSKDFTLKGSNVYILPDLRSVSITEQKLFSKGLKDFEARTPKATKKIKLLAIEAFTGRSAGYIPTEQIRVKKIM